MLLTMSTNDCFSSIAARWLSPSQYLAQSVILHPLTLIHKHLRRLTALLLTSLRKELFFFLHHLLLKKCIPQVYLSLISRWGGWYLFGTRGNRLAGCTGGLLFFWPIGPKLVGGMVTFVLLAGGLVVHDVKEQALVQLRIVYWNPFIFLLGGQLAALLERGCIWRFVRGTISIYHD